MNTHAQAHEYTHTYTQARSCLMQHFARFSNEWVDLPMLATASSANVCHLQAHRGGCCAEEGVAVWTQGERKVDGGGEQIVHEGIQNNVFFQCRFSSPNMVIVRECGPQSPCSWKHSRASHSLTQGCTHTPGRGSAESFHRNVGQQSPSGSWPSVLPSASCSARNTENAGACCAAQARHFERVAKLNGSAPPACVPPAAA